MQSIAEQLLQSDPFESEPDLQYESDESNGSDDPQFHILRDVLAPGRQCLGINTGYVPGWNSGHAIREFYQNWMDGIVESSSLFSRDVQVLNKGFDRKDVYTIEARHPDSRDLLGFITWKNGTLEFSNFGSQLKRKSLELGVSSKRQSERTAGTHGEGYKIASLVMLRTGFKVRYEASSYYWNFQLGGRDKDVLYCKLSPMGVAKLEKQKMAYCKKTERGMTRQLQGNIWEDVTVKIGKVQGRGREVERAAFQRWIKVSLDLDPPSEMLHTSVGNLILDQRFGNKLYLKGLLLEEQQSSTSFLYGYNFFTGEINRDRGKLEDPKQEAKILAEIWGQVTKQNEADTVSKLVEMLQADRTWADVNLAEDYISLETATRIWKHLHEQNAEGKRFYYFAGNGDQDIELITQSLKKEPYALKKATWLPLRRHRLIRTPEEQRYHLLENAPVSVSNNTPYSDGVKRALRSILALDPRTENFQLDFRNRPEAELDILLKGDQLLVNDRWLDFHRSHQRSQCSLFAEAAAQNFPVDQFTCGHTLTELYILMLVELSKGSNSMKNKSSKSDEFFRLRVSEAINLMPFGVESEPGNDAGQIKVSWVHLESEKMFRLYGLKFKGRVTLHREKTCSDKRDCLIAPGLEEATTAPSLENLNSSSLPELSANLTICQCPEQLVSLKDSKTLFENLDQEEAYFPMVSRIHPNSFYALPPNPIKPKQCRPSASPRFNFGNEDITRSENPNRASARDSSVGDPAYDSAKHEPEGDIYNETFSELGDDSMEVDESIENLPIRNSRTTSRGNTQVFIHSPSDSNVTLISPGNSPLRIPRRNWQARNTAKDVELQAAKYELEKLRIELENATEAKLKLQNMFISLEAEVETLREKPRQSFGADNNEEVDHSPQNHQSNSRASEQLMKQLEKEFQEARADFVIRGDYVVGPLQAISTHERLLKKAGDEINSLEQCIEKFKEEIVLKQTELDDARAKLSEAAMQNHTSNKQIDDLKVEIQKLQTLNAELQTELADTQVALATQARLAANANARCMAVKQELQEVDNGGADSTPTRKRRRKVEVTEAEKENAIENG